MKIKNICIGEKYEKDGQEKTAWKTVGTMFVHETTGNIGFKLFMFPGLSFQAFDPKEKEDAKS